MLIMRTQITRYGIQRGVLVRYVYVHWINENFYAFHVQTYFINANLIFRDNHFCTIYKTVW